MPIYEYRCTSCGRTFEKMVKLDAPVPACPECGAVDDVRKLVSAAGFVLKGGGWYRDHYGLKSSSGSKDGGASKDGGGASGGSAPTPPASTGGSSSGGGAGA